MHRYLLSAFILLVFVLGGCATAERTVHGHYELEEGIKKDDIQIRLVVIENGSQVEAYPVRLLPDGSFRASIKEDGDLSFIIDIAQWESPPLVDPHISTDLRRFDLAAAQSGIDIGKLYVSRAIELESIISSTEFQSPSEVGFTWRSIPFADYYDVGLSRIRDDLEYEAVWSTHNLVHSVFRLSEARTYGHIEGSITVENLQSMPPFNRLVGRLEPAEYKATVTAYKVELGDQGAELVVVGQTSPRLPFHFTIE